MSGTRSKSIDIALIVKNPLLNGIEAAYLGSRTVNMPSQYFLFVNSRPQPGSGVDDDLWTKWYIEEHVSTSTRHLLGACFHSLLLGKMQG